MRIRTNRIAPLALAVSLAFGVAACEGDTTVDDEVQDVEDGAESVEEGAESEMEEGTDEMEDGADEMESEMDEEATDEG